MAKVKSVWVCTSCGADSPKWEGRCPSCGEWNTLVEEKISVKPGKSRTPLGSTPNSSP
ncbi:MAG: DNA repair protein RadA, partial [Paramuribaculum sp.]|nr:DNA repair protein RadA [Paramuribaculum sp.]